MNYLLREIKKDYSLFGCLCIIVQLKSFINKCFQKKLVVFIIISKIIGLKKHLNTIKTLHYNFKYGFLII